MVRALIARVAEPLDGLSHRLGLDLDVLCGIYDIVLGWDPNDPRDDPTSTPFLRRFHDWYWGDECRVCNGAGRMNLISYRPEEGWRSQHDIECQECGGTGVRR